MRVIWACIVQSVAMILPWSARRYLLCTLLKFRIHASARIGYSIILAQKVVVCANAKVGSFNVVKGLNELFLDEWASLGSLNWITGGQPLCGDYFSHRPDRHPSVVIEAHGAVTSRHVIDATDSVRIGAFSIVAGYRCQILTHGIDFEQGYQDCKRVNIGKYCFIGSGSIILKGVSIADYSIVGAGSVVARTLERPYALYGGIPARYLKDLRWNLPYFIRNRGRVF